MTAPPGLKGSTPENVCRTEKFHPLLEGDNSNAVERPLLPPEVVPMRFPLASNVRGVSISTPSVSEKACKVWRFHFPPAAGLSSKIMPQPPVMVHCEFVPPEFVAP